MSREVRHIFKDTTFINNQREPPSLGRILHHSQFDESNHAGDRPIFHKCNFRGCKTCDDILEIDSYYFRNADITFKIKYRMSCIVRNVIYALICKNCGQTYIGETVNLRSRMTAHRSNSRNTDDASQVVSKHLSECGRGFHVLPLYKLKEENKIARLVKEDFFIKLLKPDLNSDSRDILKLKALPRTKH